MKRFFLAVFLAVVLTVPVTAEIVEKTIVYEIDQKPHEGFVIYDDANKQPMPGVIVVHEWKGISEHVMESGRELAKLGYIAMIADIYGQGIRPADSKAAAQLSGSYKKDRPLLRKKVLAALEQLNKQPLVDKEKIAAIGYCFGGTTVLELARSGADVAGVVSFHGGLDSPAPQDAKNIKARILVLHGGIDPHVPDTEVAGFIKEMRDAKVDWQLVYYGDAVHSFTSKAAGNDPSRGAAYHELTARRSWKAMKSFFKELFK
jgi:dienelactone hydrolase